VHHSDADTPREYWYSSVAAILRATIPDPTPLVLLFPDNLLTAQLPVLLALIPADLQL